MARTKPTGTSPIVRDSTAQPPSSSQRAAKTTHPQYSRKAVKTISGSQVQPAPRPTTSQKTPAHLYRHTGYVGGRGKSYYPLPPKQTRGKKRPCIVAPPLTPKPIKRGAGAIHEITYHQRNTQHLIPKKPFQRLVREIAQEYKTQIRFTPGALDALQEAAETTIIKLFTDANLVALHSKRITPQPKDFQLVLRLQGSCLRSE